MPPLFIFGVALSYAPATAYAPANSYTSANFGGFGPAATDAELASVVTEFRFAAASPMPLVGSPELAPLSTADQIDVWWAYDGATLIAEAVRPTPDAPAALGFTPRGDGPLSLHFDINVNAGPLT